MILSRFNRNSVCHLAKTLEIIMNRNKTNLANLKKAKPTLAGAKTTSAVQSENSSPYFSPMRTRNQRKHLQVKYENDTKAGAASESVREKSATDLVKQELSVSPMKDDKSGIAEVSSIDVPVKKEIKKRKSEEVKVKTETTANIPPKSEVKEEPNVSQKHAKWVPTNWVETLGNMRAMRLERGAPVDTMGCHKCADPDADSKTQRFHNLIALMLSSQTKDQTTFDAMNRLKAKSLTPQTMVAIDTNELEKLLCPVSFYKTKAKNIQKASQMLIDQYDADIPPSVEELIKLPGVGPKMAHICMKTAWNVVSGIGVDTHVHRISNRLKWVPKPTKEPEQTRIELEKWVPFELWSEVNEMMVGFGQTICTPTNPKCNECINYRCPSRVIKKK